VSKSVTPFRVLAIVSNDGGSVGSAAAQRDIYINIIHTRI
jgi:hypothetical protein